MDLLASKTLTISKLLALAPPGTLDPAPHLYDTTMYGLSGLMALAFVAQSLVRPVAALPTAGKEGQVVDATATVVSEKTTVEGEKEAVAGDRLVK